MNTRRNCLHTNAGASWWWNPVRPREVGFDFAAHVVLVVHGNALPESGKGLEGVDDDGGVGDGVFYGVFVSLGKWAGQGI